MINLRLIEKKDYSFVIDIENNYFNQVTYDDFIKYYVCNNLFIIYIIHHQEDRLGYIMIWLDEDKAQIYSMYILEEFRKQGVAYSSLQFIEKTLIDKGVGEWTLEVRESNLPAISLYQKIGFKTIGRRKDYYTNHEDALYMYKELRK
jgi:ribosomal-protein-alanine N-acetyltransferase